MRQFNLITRGRGRDGHAVFIPGINVHMHHEFTGYLILKVSNHDYERLMRCIFWCKTFKYVSNYLFTFSSCDRHAVFIP